MHFVPHTLGTGFEKCVGPLVRITFANMSLLTSRSHFMTESKESQIQRVQMVASVIRNHVDGRMGLMTSDSSLF